MENLISNDENQILESNNIYKEETKKTKKIKIKELFVPIVKVERLLEENHIVLNQKEKDEIFSCFYFIVENINNYDFSTETKIENSINKFMNKISFFINKRKTFPVGSKNFISKFKEAEIEIPMGWEEFQNEEKLKKEILSHIFFSRSISEKENTTKRLVTADINRNLSLFGDVKNYFKKFDLLQINKIIQRKNDFDKNKRTIWPETKLDYSREIVEEWIKENDFTIFSVNPDEFINHSESYKNNAEVINFSTTKDIEKYSFWCVICKLALELNLNQCFFKRNRSWENFKEDFSKEQNKIYNQIYEKYNFKEKEKLKSFYHKAETIFKEKGVYIGLSKISKILSLTNEEAKRFVESKKIVPAFFDTQNQSQQTFFYKKEEVIESIRKEIKIAPDSDVFCDWYNFEKNSSEEIAKELHDFYFFKKEFNKIFKEKLKEKEVEFQEKEFIFNFPIKINLFEKYEKVLFFKVYIDSILPNKKETETIYEKTSFIIDNLKNLLKYQEKRIKTLIEKKAKEGLKNDKNIEKFLHKSLSTNKNNSFSLVQIKQIEKHLDIFSEINKYSKIIKENEDIINRLPQNGYPSLFPVARMMNRKWKAYLGPTNSGKTHQALEELKSSEKGIYLAPLRLLALEVYEKLNREGVMCNLITGEEKIIIPGATHTAATIEAGLTEEIQDVVVIDEIQMIQDKDRGWAWVQSLIGIPSKTIILAGSSVAEDDIKKLAEILNEEKNLEIREFQRKNKIKVNTKEISIKEWSVGDAWIAFSRKDVLSLKFHLEKFGAKPSCIYGNLGPSARRLEAEKFKSGKNNVLIATDAIGMGLNLPIKRVVFSSIEKFDGYSRRELEEQEILQIGGRAGRFGIQEEGEVAFLNIQQGSKKIKDKTVQLFKHGIKNKHTDLFKVRAPWSVLEKFKDDKNTTLYSILNSFIKAVKNSEWNEFCSGYNDDVLEWAMLLDKVNLSLEKQNLLLGCPVPQRGNVKQKVFYWLKDLGQNKKIYLENFEIDINKAELKDLEEYSMLLRCYLWLCQHFSVYFHEEKEVRLLDEEVQKKISNMLSKKVKHFY